MCRVLRWFFPLFFLITFIANLSAAIFEHVPLPADVAEALKARKLWQSSCPLDLSRLRLVKLSYYDFEGKSHDDGELLVLDAAAPHVLAIFKELYAQRFPIAKVRLTRAYDGDDNLSMTANNTSAYNCREMTGGGAPSVHAYGLAIDLNPVQNPYIGQKEGPKQLTATRGIEILPPSGQAFLNRSNRRNGMSEAVVTLFRRHGFSIWGGTWNDPIDWQHFQTSRTVAQLLAAMTHQHAQHFFEHYIRYPTMLNKTTAKTDGAALLTLYQKDPDRFVSLFERRGRTLAKHSPSDAIALLTQWFAQ